MKPIRIGTRRSKLAMAQTGLVAAAVRARRPGAEIELVPVVTAGDTLAGPLTEIGGKGLFTAELEQALRSGQIDIAVHSAKDMPAELPAGLAILAALPREDVRDALVSRGGGGLESLPVGAVVGTSSLRRSAQLTAARGDVRVAPLRGNVETRVRKALGGRGEAPQLDAAVLAMAGLKRSGLLEEFRAHIQPLELEQMIPAAAQGIIAVQGRAEDAELAGLLGGIDDPAAHQALEAERSVLLRLGADCRSCLAVYIAPANDGWEGLAMRAAPDGGDMLRISAAGPTAADVAASLARRLT